ncbi:MAG: response regulator [Lentisphaeraceae bacterium]|nr:response regulator [Lentisphaeraceae bacterium]
MSPLVLIVDDDPTTLMLLKGVLDLEGYSPITCSNGELALEMMQTLEFRVVILDINLPGINGWKVLDYIEEEAPRTAVLLLTGDTTDKLSDFEEKISDRNDLEVVRKPLSKNDFIPKLEKLTEVSMTKSRKKFNLD